MNTEIIDNKQVVDVISYDEIGESDYYDLEFNEETIRDIFGHEAAEDEELEKLKKYFIKTDVYKSLRSPIPLYILVGHKGVGKSAIFKVLASEDEEQGNISITIQPDDILDIKSEEEDFLQRIRDWKKGLSRIIFRELMSSLDDRMYRSNSPDNPFSAWTNNAIKVLSSLIGSKIQDFNDEKLKMSDEDIIRFFKNSLFKEKKVLIYLDDLDRGWKNRNIDIENLSAMLNAIRDLSRETKNLTFRLALRSDVYYAIRTSDETTDKIDGSVLWLKWTNYEILVMLIKRIETYFGHSVDEKELLLTKQSLFQKTLNAVFESTFQGIGHWENAPMYRVLTSLIRKRPRDLVKLCTLAARHAYTVSHSKIMTNDLQAVFVNYSNDRLTDTGNEYRSEFPKVQELLLKMKPSAKEIRLGHPCKYTRAELLEKLKNIVSMSNFTMGNGKQASVTDIAAFLYKINFITARKDNGKYIQRIYYDENQYIYNDFTDFGYDYEIHPAYRWALQPSNIDGLFYQIELLSDGSLQNT